MTKKFKDVVKTNPEPARGTVGVNPMDPWSAKANLAESASLNQYLLSRGINPKFVSTETKIAHAKSSAFLKWKQNHQFEEIQTEEVDKEDTLTFDIPLMIRMLELAREDVKDDMELHRITERLISIRNKGTLTMDDYDFIAGIKKLKEELEELAEQMCDKEWKKISQARSEKLRVQQLKVNEVKTMPGTALSKFRSASAEREKKHDEIQKQQSKSGEGMTSAIDRLQKHLNKEETEQLDEISKSTLDSYRDKSRASLKTAQTNRDAAEPGKNMSKGFADLHAKSDATAKKRVKGLMGYLQRKQGVKPMGEDVFQDPQAATQTVFDGGNNTNDTDNVKRQMSKSARMIKALYRHLNMREDTYDWEKADKSIATPGKKPKLHKEEPGNKGKEKPEARIVMSGGKTLTGEKRDTVEIDPLMKQRPDLNGNISDKKQDNKNDK